ncbi:putative permease [Clostridium sp. N3C]|uniref:permease n=1 Tax=Clostridium sp. N3C TaxID=1776758 RepID=UPI00092E142F|nr:permease [Clostridium sp. N3C]SCN22972.1 putative permease [Clostridium sp. N3C]
MDQLKNFSTIFMSLILEGFPFLILGALVSSLIQLKISEEKISSFKSKSKILSLLVMAVAGVFFPVCECAMVPIVRRLVKKGMPIGMAITFMTAVPIVNPIVFMSTYYAFLGHSYIAVLRFALGIVCSIIIGYLMQELTDKNPLKEEKSHHDHHCCCGHSHHHGNHKKESTIKVIVGHVSEEFYEIGRFFILGALLSSLFQGMIPRHVILKLGSGRVSSILMMMLLAFVLSICSETDAFIARTFFNQFTGSSVMAFLIFGPMIDIKNTIMLLSNFKLNFIIKLIFVIFAVCFLIALLLPMLGLGL